MSHPSFAEKWQTLSGQTHWKGLIEPLDIDLRRYLLHYGERAQACYDTFTFDPKSAYAGSSKYSEADLFEHVGLEKGNPYKYSVVKYLYATSSMDLPSSFMVDSMCPFPWCKKSNWIGYIALATEEGMKALGRRDILIAWRGTIDTLEWQADFNFPLIPAPEIFGQGNDIKVHQGWHSMYTAKSAESKFNKSSVREQILPELEHLIEKYKNDEISITVTGHSLGAGLATINAADIAAHEFPKKIPVTAFPFACPRVGNPAFKNFCDSKENLRMLRVTNVPDMVPQVPPPTAGYVDVGEELKVDHRKSEYINYDGTPLAGHELESAYLHAIAGTHGPHAPFKLEVNRDIALVNKFTNALKARYLIPGYWWVLKNMGMHQIGAGTWSLKDHFEK